MRLVSFLLFLLAFVAQPASAAASSPILQSLEHQLAAIEASRPGDVGIAALDLTTGQMISINGNRPFPMASTMKIAVAANYLAQVEHGRRSLNDRISGRTAADWMERMMVHSDNHATDVLIRDLGGPDTLQAWLSQRGITGLRIDRNIAQLLRSKRDLWDIRDSSTPEAMVELLRQIDNGNLIKPWSRGYLLELMRRCATGRNRIPAMLPDGTRVEHKTGTLSGLTTDVGYITLPGGRRIAIAVFARGGSNRPQSIARAARAVYDGFAAAWRHAYMAARFGTAASATSSAVAVPQH
jgi:beta-lactamase class A